MDEIDICTKILRLTPGRRRLAAGLVDFLLGDLPEVDEPDTVDASAPGSRETSDVSGSIQTETDAPDAESSVEEKH